MITEKFEALKTVMQNLSENALFAITNTYSEMNCTGDNLYPMCDFDELNNELTPLEVLQSVDSEDFNVNDDYFYTDSSTGLYCSTNNVFEYLERVFDVSDICESLETDWWRYAQNFPKKEKQNILDDICDEFFEWAQSQGEGEWVEMYVDGDECIERDWNEYLEELKQEHEQDEQDE